jgi:hypothetical protein
MSVAEVQRKCVAGVRTTAHGTFGTCLLHDANPQAMRLRRETVEHPFGTMKAAWERHTSSPKRFQK